MSSATAVAPQNGTAPPAVDPWSMEVPTPGEGGDYVLCPAGNHPGVIVGLFDVGHHEEKYDGEAKEMRKLAVVIELKKKRPDGKPFLLAERYTWSLSEKSKFYALASTVMGHKFKEGEKFDPRALIGVPVMASVVHAQGGKEDKTYHNLQSLAQYPEDFPAIEPTHAKIVWSIVAGGPWPDGCEDLPRIYGVSIKELAKQSREYKAREAAAKQANGTADVPF